VVDLVPLVGFPFGEGMRSSEEGWPEESVAGATAVVCFRTLEQVVASIRRG
jgi:hypothetical protein